MGGVLDVASTLDIIEKKGAFYYYDGKVLAQGREGAKQLLREDPKFAKKVEDEIRKVMKEGKNIPKEIGETNPELGEN